MATDLNKSKKFSKSLDILTMFSLLSFEMFYVKTL